MPLCHLQQPQFPHLPPEGVRLRKVFFSFKLQTNLSPEKLLKFPDDFCFFSLKLTNRLEMVWGVEKSGIFELQIERVERQEANFLLINLKIFLSDRRRHKKCWKRFFTDFQLLLVNESVCVCGHIAILIALIGHDKHESWELSIFQFKFSLFLDDFSISLFMVLEVENCHEMTD